MMCTARRLATGALVLCTPALHAQVPQEWTIQLQARSTLDANLPGFNLPFPSALSSQSVSLAEDGGVAIRVILGGGQEGIFYGKDAIGGIIVTGNGGDDPFWSSTIDLRNGLIGIEQGSFDDGAFLYSIDGTLLQTFAPGGPEGVSGFSGLTITSDGALCYRGDFGFVSDKVVIDEFINANRTQTLITQTGSTSSFLFAPAVNDNRQVVMNTIPNAGPSRRIIRFAPDATPTTVAETGSLFNAFVNSTALAQNGDVAFSARRTADSVWQVTRWDGGSLIPIAEGSNSDIDNGSLANFPPVLNSNGMVAFRATDTAHDSTALWVGDGSELVKLVEYGQLVDTDLGPIELGFDFGADTGRQVMNGRIDINDSGQVAFAAFLRNGTIGVFVATPAAGCIADFNNDGAADFFDVSDFLSAFQNADPDADINNDGTVDFFDVSDFLGAFAAGCP